MWQYLKTSVFVNALLLAFAVFLAYKAALMAGDVMRVRKEAEDTQKRIAELTHKKQELEQYLAELETAQAIEREAKERLNVKRPGEEVVVVVPEQKKEERVEEARNDTFWESFRKKIRSFFEW